ncbi:TonB-dependent receptor [Polynucleobacter sp. UK-Kesae-W10]|uniref:TonB-dependent receptor n=1 Tax=Polynucleobacter sp. UK-Kesae-W10 TaxID=1819738 RepID=UPI001C0E5C8F|nr:TonB-dependent receptor [Polynucleobacter sp. UK-Kesae-W10]MBU3577987.1 TonB-dependent receptor [Polynucleobacter sp. UK-Kesae-W10]
MNFWRHVTDQSIGIFLGLLCANSLACAQTEPETSLQVNVTGARDDGQGFLSASKVLTGDELQNKLGGTLGATLANELGVSATGYGAGASRPVIRGLEGARVQILQNGLSVGDVSSISADHAVASPMQNTHQIEILRGASALLYGSGSSGGLVNVVNDRIVTSLPDALSGAVNTSYETANQGKTGNLELDAPAGPLALHLDTSISNSNNYQIPGYAEQGGPNANWAINPGNPVNIPYSGKLPFSYSNQNSLGLGASYIRADGYTGVSLERMNHNYGIPTAEGGFIQQSQNRYDFAHQSNDPFDGFSSVKISAANTNYQHTEFTNNGIASTLWNNTATEARLELAHKELLGLKGIIGAQVTGATLNASDLTTNSYAIVPQTKSNASALFWVEEGRYGALKTSLGARYSYTAQNPNTATQFPAQSTQGFTPNTYGPPAIQNRQFNLMSYSAGGMLDVAKDYGLGLTYTVSQRAPTPQELYSYGPHDSTATFDIGNSNLGTETSQNIELSFQKTLGLVRSKVSLYRNQFSNYIYGFYTGSYSQANENFSVVQASQANANIRGAEGEISYNWNQTGIGGRLFGDVSQGSFNAGGNLPLQPAPRLGTELAYQQGGWLTSATYIYSYQQNRLATWEVGPTPSYNLLNANLSYTERIGKINWTGYLALKNLLNEDIRYATSPMAVRLYAPQPGRSLMLGVRAAF